MKRKRQIIRILKWGIGVLFVPILIYVLLAFVLSFISVGGQKESCDPATKLFLASNGIHVDIILPISALPDSFLQQLAPEAQMAYLGFGWGDKAFYLETPTWSDLKWSTAMGALFLQSESVVHLTQYQSPGAEWKSTPICNPQLQAILSFLKASFAYTPRGDMMEIPDAAYSHYDRFYEGEGNYTCLYTCNTWVNSCLKEAQIKTAVWTPFDFGVLYHFE